MLEPKITVNQELLKLIAELDEFKGRWALLKTLSLAAHKQLSSGHFVMANRCPGRSVVIQTSTPNMGVLVCYSGVR